MKALYLFLVFSPIAKIMTDFKYYDLALKKCELSQNFSIHGLWPELNPNQWPQFCHPSIFNQSALDSLMPRLTQNWYSCPEQFADNEGFWKHEWLKHGTCSQFNNETEFFNTTLNLFDQLVEQNLISHYCSDTELECLIHFHLNLTLVDEQ